jgi:damage-control phosphatase, subfamily II, stand-alone protein
MLDKDPVADLPGLGKGKICCKRLCLIRDTCLRDVGFWDPYLAIKAAENDKALALLPLVLKELDAVLDDAARFEMAVKGVFAGNIFDLGAPDLAAKYEAGADAGDMFAAAKDNLLGRPWVVDELDALQQRMSYVEVPPHKKAMIFVDNAGADFVLGLLPFARELLKRGTAVVIAANAVASINDMTYGEARDVIAAAAVQDDVLCEKVAKGALRVVNSGNDLPMIDLSEVSQECAQEAEGTDLVVLEGMGRGIESNLYAKFRVESLKLAMVKHREVAQSLGGRLYDCVCQYFPAEG